LATGGLALASAHLLEGFEQRRPILVKAEVDDGQAGELARIAANEVAEGRVGSHDPAVGVEHGLADWGGFERAAQQRLGALQSATARLELGEHHHLGAQELGVERLQEVVDGTQAVPARDVFHLVPRRGQKHDRDIAGPGALFDQFRSLQAVEPGHPHVQEDHREVLLEQHPQRAVPGARGDQRVAERLEHGLQRAQVFRLIVDEQDRQRPDRGEVRHRLRNVRTDGGGVGGCACVYV
jgi:hypothetical protein